MKLSKEIRFFRIFSRLMENEPEDPLEMYSEIAGILPEAMAYPDKCLCGITVKSKAYGSIKSSSHDNCISERLETTGSCFGYLHVWYTSTDIKFSPGEREMICYMGKIIGKRIEEYQRKAELASASEKLIELNRQLENKNTALAELLKNGPEILKNTRKDTVELVHNSIMPNLHKLEEQIGNNFYLELLKLTISSLVSHEDRTMFHFNQLSQRELECCYLINRGFSSKDIARKFHISPKTVDRHRANIRKKLGITGQKKNLSTSLKFIDQN